MLTIAQILAILEKPSVSEIVLNGPDSAFVKQDGTYMSIREPFNSIDGYWAVLEQLAKMVAPGEELGEYLFEGPLEFSTNEGKTVRSRCHMVLPPVSSVPQVVIAKKSETVTSLDSMVEKGSLTGEMAEFLKACVKTRRTMVILGATGSGKTTMLESLCRQIPQIERIGVAEDTPEIVLNQPNVSYYHSVPWKPGMNPNDVATLSWVVQQFQRARVDRLIVGETRGKEFADFLTASNSGIEGSLTTLHANTPNSGLLKMTSFALKGEPGRNTQSINQEIATAIDILVQLRKNGGKYRIGEITEVTGTVSSDESAKMTTQTLFKHNAENDTFFRVGPPTDRLRKVFAERGVDINTILTSPIGLTGRF